MTDVILEPTTTLESIDEQNGDSNEEKPILSKKQQRKLRRQEHWLANKSAKRAKEKEKLKEKRSLARLNNVELGPTRKRLKESTMADSDCKIRVVVDMSFDDYMGSHELNKCVKQLLRCYALNRRAANPMQLYFTSFEGKCKEVMEKNNGYRNWDVNFRQETYTEIFSKDDIVYLTSESENSICTLDESKVYIIGGLVDHNTHKGLCHKLAVEKGIAHGHLPISEFLEMKSRKVLTIDHVFEILLGKSQGLDWLDAFLKVIPQRKGAITKECTNKDVDENTIRSDLSTTKNESIEKTDTIEDKKNGDG